MANPLNKIAPSLSSFALRLGPISLATLYTNILQFVLFALMARFCPEESLGLYKYFLTIYALISLCVIPGTAYTTKQFSAISKENVLNQAWSIKIKYSYFGVILLIAVIPVFMLMGKPEMFWPCVLAGFLLPIFEASESTQFYLSGLKNLNPYFFWTLIRHTVMFLGIVLIVLLKPKFLEGPTLFYLFFSTFVSFGLFSWYNKGFPTLQPPSPEFAHNSKAFSWVVWLNRIRSEADVLILGSLFALQEVAFLTIGRQFLMLWKQAAQITMLGVYNRLAAGTVKESIRDLNRIFLWGGLAALPIIVGGVLALPPLIRAVYGPAYESSILFAQIFWGSAIILLPASHLNNWFQARGLNKPLLVLGTWSLLFDLVFLSGFIYVYGPIGIAYGEITSQLFQLVVYILLIIKEYQKSQQISEPAD